MTIRRMVFSRNRYFSGKALGKDDLEAEQDYFREKQYFRNLFTYGTGIVSGLSVKTGSTSSFFLTPGYAIDATGREICVPSAIECPLPRNGDRWLICVSYVEAAANPTPTLGDPRGQGAFTENSRIEEGFEITVIPIAAGRQVGRQPFSSHSESELSAGIPLAVLQRKGTRWIVTPASRGAQARTSQKRSMK